MNGSNRLASISGRIVLRVAAFVAVLSIVILAVVPPASAGSSYWWNADRLENSWYTTHPWGYYHYHYLSVDTDDCGSVCSRFLDSTSSGLIQSSSKIHHWPSGGSANSYLSCKWDTVGSGSTAHLICYRSW